MTNQGTQNHTVVIIDDDKDDLILMEQAISSFNPDLECTLFSDPEIAVRHLIHEGPVPSCIFLDINMPKLTGDQVLSQIRSHEKLNDVTVVMISTSMSHEQAARLLREGANYTFPKPVMMSQYEPILEAVFPATN